MKKLFKRRLFVPYSWYEEVLAQADKDSSLAAELVNECQRLSSVVDELTEENNELRTLMVQYVDEIKTTANNMWASAVTKSAV